MPISRSVLAAASHDAGLVCLVLVAALRAAGASAEDFWCGDKIITSGMTTGQVLAACGHPAGVRASPGGHHHRYVNGYPTEEAYEPPGELWTYNFGSTRLMQRLLFVDGVLSQTTTLSFGYDN